MPARYSSDASRRVTLDGARIRERVFAASSSARHALASFSVGNVLRRREPRAKLTTASKLGLQEQRFFPARVAQSRVWRSPIPEGSRRALLAGVSCVCTLTSWG